jgi:thymidine kinase
MSNKVGQIEVITGGMFSGKTEELIRRIRRAVIAQQSVQVFKHQFDNRYEVMDGTTSFVTSHNGEIINATILVSADQLISQILTDTSVIGIDEVQFFDISIVQTVEYLASAGIRVIVAGLDMDFRGEPFGPVSELLARAEDITKLRAICSICGEEASRSQRLIDGNPAFFEDPIILVGATEVYEARCRRHHIITHNTNT